VITTDADELVAEIHDRMPLILAPGDYARWLNYGNDCGSKRLAFAKRFWV
jgi:putative SOS response-associated peptidase YedK